MAATAELMIRLNSLDKYVAAIQEPWVSSEADGGHIKGISSGKLHGHHFRARAALVVSNSVDMWPVHEFTNWDMATACIRTNGRLMYISSVYMDGTVLRIDENVQRLATLCRTRGIGLIICSDTNAHSTLWGYDESDD